jgi:hypothetical protein
LSRVGFDELIKKKPSFKCPVPGCDKAWSKASAQLDKNFIKKMNKFNREQSSQSQRNSTQSFEI